MPKFMLAYHGGEMPQSEEEGEKMIAAWMGWLAGLGTAVADAGNPVGLSKTVHRDRVVDDGGANPLSGYSILIADDINAACEMAGGCPILNSGSGSVEVAEIHEI